MLLPPRRPGLDLASVGRDLLDADGDALGANLLGVATAKDEDDHRSGDRSDESTTDEHRHPDVRLGRRVVGLGGLGRQRELGGRSGLHFGPGSVARLHRQLLVVDDTITFELGRHTVVGEDDRIVPVGGRDALTAVVLVDGHRAVGSRDPLVAVGVGVAAEAVERLGGNATFGRLDVLVALDLLRDERAGEQQNEQERNETLQHGSLLASPLDCARDGLLGVADSRTSAHLRFNSD